jgi:hypothetical protein
MFLLDDDDAYADDDYYSGVMIGLPMKCKVFTANSIEDSLVVVDYRVVDKHAQSSEVMIDTISRVHYINGGCYSPPQKYVCDECSRESEDSAGWVIERDPETTLCPTCWSEAEDDDDGGV